MIAFNFSPFESRGEVVGLRFSYQPDVVQRLKELLKPYHLLSRQKGLRSAGGWLKEHGCWYIEPFAWPAIRRGLENLGEYIDDHDLTLPPQDEPPRSRSTGEIERLVNKYPDHAALYVLPTAPMSVIRAAYRALAQDYHPDHNDLGHEKMVQLNLAWERLGKGGTQ